MNFFRIAMCLLERLYGATLPVYKVRKWKQVLDNSPTFAALLPDLWKAFDSLSHEVSIAELNARGFEIDE